MTPSRPPASAQVVLVRFPFTDLVREKKRPALVLFCVPLSRSDHLTTIAMITSRVEDKGISGDVLLSDWKAAGLLHPSRVRLAKVATIDRSLVDRMLGRLVPRDVAAVKQALLRLSSFWT